VTIASGEHSPARPLWEERDGCDEDETEEFELPEGGQVQYLLRPALGLEQEGRRHVTFPGHWIRCGALEDQRFSARMVGNSGLRRSCHRG
jgi:hypothetical protein